MANFIFRYHKGYLKIIIMIDIVEACKNHFEND